MEIFDTHAHLSRTMFEDLATIDALVERARERGVTRITTIGAAGDLAVSREAIEVAERHPDVWATVGYHPHRASEWSATAAAGIRELSNHPKVRAIGETGLDYHYEYSTPAEQELAFREQVQIACEVDLPVIIHSREAESDTATILEEEGAERCGGVIHCFSSGWELARRALDLGFYISFSGIVTFKRSDALREAARKVPEDRLLVETDSPFLAPVPKRGKKNEPAFVAHTLAAVAEARGASVEQMAAVTTANALRFYGLDG